MWRIEVQGLTPTLNMFYSGMHWTKRNALKNEWRAQFYYAIKEARLPRFEGVIHAQVTQFSKRTPRDVDNAVVAAKFFLDALKDAGCIVDDKPEYVGSLMLQSRKGKENKIVIIIHQ